MPVTKEFPDFDEEDFKRNQEPIAQIEVSIDISDLPLGRQFEYAKFCREIQGASKDQLLELLKQCQATLIKTQYMAGEMLVKGLKENLKEKQ